MDFVFEIESILENMTKNSESCEAELRNLIKFHNESGEELTITDYFDDENPTCSCCGGNEIKFTIRLKETKICKVVQFITDDEHKVEIKEVGDLWFDIVYDEEEDD